MSLIRKSFDFKGTPILAGLFITLFILESKFQLRKRVQNRWQRIKVNTQVAFPSFVLLRFMFLPAMVWLASRNSGVRSQISRLIPWHPARQVFAFLLLDYTNYLWHVLNHKIPFLWRFHVVHHIDKDLDLTTAFRFHFGEMIGSLFYRGAFTYLSGANPITVIVYEIAFEGATEFHHSNWRLPQGLETLLNKVVVTPRMHGIHHSVEDRETNANFSVIFSFWDRLNQTLNLEAEQEKITIGVTGYQHAEKLSPKDLLLMPFSRSKPE